MLTEVHPLLPMRDRHETKTFYIEMLGFEAFDPDNKYERYLMVRKEGVELHFTLKENLDPDYSDYSCYIRTDNVEHWYQLAKEKHLDIATELREYPWHQTEFVLRDPNFNQLVLGGEAQRLPAS